MEPCKLYTVIGFVDETGERFGDWVTAGDPGEAMSEAVDRHSPLTFIVVGVAEGIVRLAA